MLAMPSGGTVCSQTVACLLALFDRSRQPEYGINPFFSIQIGNFSPHNKNKMVEIAKEQKATHMLIIDPDMVFPDWGLLQLLEDDKDIVGANYNMRGQHDTQEVRISTVKFTDKQGNYIPKAAKDIPKQLFECAGLGTGFMLIKMSVFDKLEKPYFVLREDADGQLYTADMNFCKAAVAAGFKVWCDPTIGMGHIGQYNY